MISLIATDTSGGLTEPDKPFGPIAERAAGFARELRSDAIARDRDGADGIAQLARATDLGLLHVESASRSSRVDLVPMLAELVRVLASADPGVADALARHHCARLAIGAQRVTALAAEDIGVMPRDQIATPASIAVLLGGESSGVTVEKLEKPAPGSGVGIQIDLRGAATARWLLAPAGAGGRGVVQLMLVPLEGHGVRRASDTPPIGLRTVAHETIVLERGRHDGWDTITLTGASGIDSTAQVLGAATELGVARAALEEVADFVRTRTRSAFESELERAADEPHLIKRVGELVVPLRAAEDQLRRAARMANAALATPASPVAQRDAAFAAAELRVLARDVATRLTSESLELAGAGATDQRYGLDRHWRDLQVLATTSGGWSARVLGERLLSEPLPAAHRYPTIVEL
jgi:hypothetical protein